MAIKIYHDEDCTQEVTEANPIRTDHPISGSTETVQVYVKNDNADRYYTDVTAQPQGDDASFIDLSLDGSDYADTLDLSDFGSEGNADTSVRNLWVKVTTPQVDEVQNRRDSSVNISAKEYAVD
ncbi:hypothetical protein BEP19_14765 [Ammoniphilus oxalaticus]|uniref:Uncharacterized protein n=1 Tax=Ammoniphilus oxalaticus TaxID=66863 RepID=A0A419SE39_9BACL|nr:hypothetical protein [Ammoniphilus oxalaticus]RKD21481.1 hypothetical protein BEP19_14765 [Ammoniphilus oxalaticus]